MAQNQTTDWFPLSTGNTQYDENQRRLWQSLYYLRDQQSTNGNAHQAAIKGMSGTVFFAGGFTMGSGPGATTYYNMTFKNGVLVAVS